MHRISKTATTLDDAAPVYARLRHCTNLPSPPGVAMQLITLCENPALEIDDLLGLVSRDPSLTAKLLRVANSPLYGGKRKTANLRQVLILFGINGVLNLALSFAITNGLKSSGGRGLDHQLFWLRSLTVAIAARCIGKQVYSKRSADLYLAGLLQDIGVLALLKAAPDAYASIDIHGLGHEALARQELAELGADHAAAGAWLLQRWQLPNWLCASVAHSHSPGALATGSEIDAQARFDVCIYAASQIAEMLSKSRVGSEHARSAQQLAAALEMDRQQFAELLAQISAEVQESAPVYDIPVNDLVTENLLEYAAELLEVRTLKQEQTLVGLRERTAELEAQARDLKEQSFRDGLTQLFNRSHLEDVLAREFICASRHAWPLSLLFIDLDDFKCINDSSGHQVGDRVLRRVADIMIYTLRDGDIGARYGGEELVVLLPGTDSAGAARLGERLNEAIRNGDYGRSATGERLHVTASIGIATHATALQFESGAALIAAADKALYVSKRSGKDCSTVYTR